MTERPILFSLPMVRAILDGRKTKTRRVVKPQSTSVIHGKYLDQSEDGDKPTKEDRRSWHRLNEDSNYYEPIRCPYGGPGDRLWVRETWAEGGSSTQLPCGEYVWSSHLKARYAATDNAIRDKDDSCYWRLRPSIHMPRWASRLTLEVVSVRVERLNEISEADARAEGYVGDGVTRHDAEARNWFAGLWDSINAKKHPWSSNPWVWVVEFKRVTP